MVAPDDWEWVQSEGVRHPLFWERHDGRWHWRGMFDLRAAAAVVAGVCQPRRSVGVRRMARLPTADARRSFSAPHTARPPASVDGIPGATRRRQPRAWRDGLLVVGSRRLPAVIPAGQSAWGIDDLVGNGWEWTSTAFAPFDGFSPCRRIRNTPRISSTASTSS